MTPSPLTRREFLQTTAAASTGAAVAHLTPGLLLGQSSNSPSPVPAAEIPAWASRPMRWAQLSLVEDDPAHFDLGFWLDYFKRTRSEGVCLSGGGCVAFYPTEIPFHHRSPWLGDRDLLGELVTGCRSLNMSVLVRTDPHATYNDAQAAHPDWIAVDIHGQPRRHWATPDMWVTCAYGPYNFDFMTAVHKEIVSRYRPDGLFYNRWNGSGDCYCIHCTTNFKSATGFDLPRTNDPQDPARQAYMQWRQQRLLSLIDLWNAEIRSINPDAVSVPNNGSGAFNQIDSTQLSDRAPMLAADRQCRQGFVLPWLVGKSAKEYRATMGSKPVIGLIGVGIEEQYRWKDSVSSAPEIRIWMLDAIANGMRPWFTKFCGTLHDRRWLEGVEQLFLWTEKNQPYLVDRKPLARVGLVYSQQTAWYYGGGAVQAKVEDYSLGWYQALIESRIQFEMVHERHLDSDHLAPYKTLILPNLAALSDAQCDQLRAFVHSGGSLIATYETSLYDQLGRRRTNFALADLFGVDWAGTTEGPMHNSYITLEHEKLPHHPLFSGLEDAPRIINGTLRVTTTPRAHFAETPFTLIPSYPDLPMEMVFPRVPHTDISCMYLRQPSSTSGRVAYIPFDLDRTFWEVLAEDHLKMLRNTVLWATGEDPAVQVEGPGLLDVTAWQNSNSITIHLVNLTNPMALKAPYRGFFPVGPHTVAVRLPAGIQPRQTRLLASEKDVSHNLDGSTLSVTVPSILDHEVIAIDI